MKNLSKTILTVFFFAILGCDNRNNLECVTEEAEIFSLNTGGERSNANEACTCMQIRMFETAAHVVYAVAVISTHSPLQAGARFVNQSQNGATGPEMRVRRGGIPCRKSWQVEVGGQVPS